MKLRKYLCHKNRDSSYYGRPYIACGRRQRLQTCKKVFWWDDREDLIEKPQYCTHQDCEKELIIVPITPDQTIPQDSEFDADFDSDKSYSLHLACPSNHIHSYVPCDCHVTDCLDYFSDDSDDDWGDPFVNKMISSVPEVTHSIRNFAVFLCVNARTKCGNNGLCKMEWYKNNNQIIENWNEHFVLSQLKENWKEHLNRADKFEQLIESYKNLDLFDRWKKEL